MLLQKRFLRNIEDFQCENCKEFVRGNGYTNHCHKCLYSKHVDVNPGDRAHSCKGLMEPINFFEKGRKFIITHKCLKCNIQKTNKAAKNDCLEKLFDMIANK